MLFLLLIHLFYLFYFTPQAPPAAYNNLYKQAVKRHMGLLQPRIVVYLEPRGGEWGFLSLTTVSLAIGSRGRGIVLASTLPLPVFADARRFFSILWLLA